MAIHDLLPGIEVTITSAGQTLKEYPTANEEIVNTNRMRKKLEHQKKVTITNYIEVTTGQAFAIKLSTKHPYVLDCPKLEYRIFVDSTWIGAPMMTETDYIDKQWIDVIEGPVSEVKEGQGFRPMCFTNLKIFEDKTSEVVITEHKEQMHGVGEIVVEVHRRSHGQESKPAPDEKSRRLDIKYDKKIHQKAVVFSAASHGTTFGEATGDISQRVWQTRSLDGEDYMRATYVFKYRSREALQQLLVLAREASPENEPAPPSIPTADVSLGEATPAEQERLLQMLMNMRSAATPGITKLKRERLSEDIDDIASVSSVTGTSVLEGFNIKQEHEGGARSNLHRKRRKSVWKEKVTIDLTADKYELESMIELP